LALDVIGAAAVAAGVAVLVWALRPHREAKLLAVQRGIAF
jgi:membrane-associated phospholipid phosphatase